MSQFHGILVGLGVVLSVLFTFLVLVTGKGDAMSGGGSVRTSFQGKASFDDQVTKWTFGLGVAFMLLALTVDIVGHRMQNAPGANTREAGGKVTDVQPIDVSNVAPLPNSPAANAAAAAAENTAPAANNAPASQ